MKTAVESFAKKLDEVAGVQPRLSPEDAGVAPPTNDHSSLLYLSGELQRISQSVDGGDAAPTDGALKALQDAEQAVSGDLQKWNAIKSADLEQLNATLKQNNLPALTLEGPRE